MTLTIAVGVIFIVPFLKKFFEKSNKSLINSSKCAIIEKIALKGDFLWQ